MLLATSKKSNVPSIAPEMNWCIRQKMKLLLCILTFWAGPKSLFIYRPGAPTAIGPTLSIKAPAFSWGVHMGFNWRISIFRVTFNSSYVILSWINESSNKRVCKPNCNCNSGGRVLTRKFHVVVVQHNGKEMYQKCAAGAKLLFCHLDQLIFLPFPLPFSITRFYSLFQ